ncbi:hypothetical protein EHS25_001815 [Saitozyma podzolica]|uniref:Uncharacterized protein n=1 Tax=Saitozyma podzolica TaxID=1890683 RepID=A0A427YF66_9TREE|nr:hypothetical protein EHS25_001815 [Saitozyma podzolica]
MQSPSPPAVAHLPQGAGEYQCLPADLVPPNHDEETGEHAHCVVDDSARERVERGDKVVTVLCGEGVHRSGLSGSGGTDDERAAEVGTSDHVQLGPLVIFGLT